MVVYDANTMAIVLWDGSLKTGALTIGAVTQAGTWNVGITGAVTLPTGASTSAKQDTGNTSLSSIDGKITAVNTGAVTISSALPAGNNNIGDVDVASIAEGANVIGKVGIDQTTPGTTNAVAVTNAFALEATQQLQATAALQTSGNASLSTLVTQTDAVESSLSLIESTTRVDQPEILRQILTELRTISYLLHTGLSVRDEPAAIRREFDNFTIQ